MKIMNVRHIFVAAVCGAMFTTSTHAGQFGKWLNRQSVKNLTGQTVTDLRVDLEQIADPTPSPQVSGFTSTVLTPDAKTILASGGNAADGGSTAVTWASPESTNRIVSGAWSRDGVQLGTLDILNVQLQIMDLADGLVRVSVDNGGPPLSYRNLAISAVWTSSSLHRMSL
jgi:hypothetical protein